MQEKSNTQTEQRQTTLDSFANFIRKHDDYVITIGICVSVMLLFKLTCVILMSQS